MTPRMALFSLTAALLYFGPFLAGMTGAKAEFLPIFGAIFLLWLAVMRPAIWTRTSSRPLALAAYLAGLTILQMLLVFLAFVLGRGISGLFEITIALPVAFPVILSLAALPLGGLVRDPAEDAAAEDDILAAGEEEDETPESGKKAGAPRDGE